MTWHFRQPSPGETTRDPIVGEFFSTDAISGSAEALVREGIQNALDASVDGKVHVRIFLGDGSQTLSADRAAPWFSQAWTHLRATGNGLSDAPTESDGCKFLVFEDFGTTGLRGNVEQAFDEPGNKNSFYYFFRAEGRTGKSESDRGRWGVGKHVFPRSSRINTVFGLTVRDDDRRRMLMGHVVLKSHKIGADHWSPDGYFGLRPAGLVLPTEDRALSDKFTADFRVKRTTEPGLSLIVPYVDEEITYGDLVRSVVDGYFFPILCGQITVEVESGDQRVSITKGSLIEAALSIGGPDEAERLARVDLAEWAAEREAGGFTDLLPCSDHRALWSNDMVPAELVPQLRTRLAGGQKIALRSHVIVRPKGKPDQVSYFDVFLWENDHDGGRPIFIREGLTITDVRGGRARGVLSMVVVRDKPLATLLGDSENPAHTQWQKTSSNFKNKYVYGVAHIDFVRRSVERIVAVLRDSGEEHDVSTLADIFPRPADEEDARPRPAERTTPKPQPDLPPDIPPLPRNPPAGYRLQQVVGGFSVQRGRPDAPTPSSLLVRVAYDIRQGNPLKKYNRADFRLDRAPIDITEERGIEIRERSENELLFDVTDPDFRLTVEGFDKNRDLYVSVSIARHDAAPI